MCTSSCTLFIIPKWSHLILFLGNIIVSYIIQVYNSLCRPLINTHQYCSLKTFTSAYLGTIHIMKVIIWCIFHHGCIDGIFPSLNILFIAAAIISPPTIFYSTNDIIFILFIIQHQVNIHV